MINNFAQDEWSKTFCLIFNELVDSGLIEKKKRFTNDVGLPQQSTLNGVLKAERNFPLERRQAAMAALRDIYGVNMEFFKDRSNPLFTRKPERLPISSGQTAMSYSEIHDLKKYREENEYLKRALADKDMIIQTQAALIKQLQVIVK